MNASRRRFLFGVAATPAVLLAAPAKAAFPERVLEGFKSGDTMQALLNARLPVPLNEKWWFSAPITVPEWGVIDSALIVVDHDAVAFDIVRGEIRNTACFGRDYWKNSHAV